MDAETSKVPVRKSSLYRRKFSIFTVRRAPQGSSFNQCYGQKDWGVDGSDDSHIDFVEPSGGDDELER